VSRQEHASYRTGENGLPGRGETRANTRQQVGLSDTGDLTGHGRPLLREAITGLMPG
jgi:hypothetical protein